jgi:hypothetical protein
MGTVETVGAFYVVSQFQPARLRKKGLAGSGRPKVCGPLTLRSGARLTTEPGKCAIGWDAVLVGFAR